MQHSLVVKHIALQICNFLYMRPSIYLNKELYCWYICCDGSGCALVMHASKDSVVESSSVYNQIFSVLELSDLCTSSTSSATSESQTNVSKYMDIWISASIRTLHCICYKCRRFILYFMCVSCHTILSDSNLALR